MRDTEKEECFHPLFLPCKAGIPRVERSGQETTDHNFPFTVCPVRIIFDLN
jgi:hypothetical protein